MSVKKMKKNATSVRFEIVKIYCKLHPLRIWCGRCDATVFASAILFWWAVVLMWHVFFDKLFWQSQMFDSIIAFDPPVISQMVFKSCIAFFSCKSFKMIIHKINISPVYSINRLSPFYFINFIVEILNIKLYYELSMNYQLH